MATLGASMMTLPDLAAVHWLRPQWLWALCALPLLAWWWRAHGHPRSAWREVVDPHLLPHLLERERGTRGAGALMLGLLGATLAICALAGPSWQRQPQPQWQSKAPLVIALDLSTASLANDLPPSRLLQARQKIAGLLQARAGGQVGLVVFADDAFTVAPLTDDAANVVLFLDALAPDIMPVDGSRADRAIDASAQLLRQARFDHGDILLLTDHADRGARATAARVARDGFRISVLGMGTTAGAAYRDAEGRIGHAALDRSSLRAVASAGDGRYADMTAGDDDLAALGVLSPQAAGATESSGAKTLVWVDQGYWLLPLILLLALFAFRRGQMLAMLLVCAWLPWHPAQASARDWWLRPEQQAHARIEQGAQAYRKGDYATARRMWSGIDDADAAYNRGNALARLGDYDAAIGAYDEALRLHPGMTDALANRQAVDAARRRKPPPGGQDKRTSQSGKGGQGAQQRGSPQQQSPQQGSQQQQSQQQQSQQAATQASSGQKQQGDQSIGRARQATASPPASAADAAAQRKADAAQRARMQRALQQARGARPGGQSVAAAQRTETPAERERRLATEAWLQRVPDDPGGLLRAKFRLEYERRRQEGE
jgi:Ca-activated chloride channel family protein